MVYLKVRWHTWFVQTLGFSKGELTFLISLKKRWYKWLAQIIGCMLGLCKGEVAYLVCVNVSLYTGLSKGEVEYLVCLKVR